MIPGSDFGDPDLILIPNPDPDFLDPVLILDTIFLWTKIKVFYQQQNKPTVIYTTIYVQIGRYKCF